MSTVRTTLTAGALLGALLAAGLAAPSPAAVASDEPAPAPTAGAPVVRADRVTVAADGWADVDVLANDADPDDATGDDLAPCRVEPVAGNPLEVFETTIWDDDVAVGSDVESGSDSDTAQRLGLAVRPDGAEPGTYTFPYGVCDFEHVTMATLTVVVLPRRDPWAEVVPGRPGAIRFHNPRSRSARFVYGSKDERTVDGRFRLAPRGSRTVRTERKVVGWTATTGRRGRGSTYSGVVLGVQRPHAAASPARPGAGTAPTTTTGGAAPTTAPDRVSVSQGWLGLADVLDNDLDPDGSGDDLAICRATAPAGSGLTLTPLSGTDGRYSFVIFGSFRGAPGAGPRGDVTWTLLVQASRRTSVGRYPVTYYACDREHLTPGTLTVEVTPSQAVTARKLSRRPGAVRFTNPSPYVARVRVSRPFDFSLEEQPPPLLRFRLPPHSSRTIRPGVRRIDWDAFSRRGPGGHGTIGGLGRPLRG